MQPSHPIWKIRYLDFHLHISVQSFDRYDSRQFRRNHSFHSFPFFLRFLSFCLFFQDSVIHIACLRRRIFLILKFHLSRLNSGIFDTKP